MSDQAKTILLVVLIVAGVGAAVFSGVHYLGAPRETVVGTLPVKSKDEEMKDQSSRNRRPPDAANPDAGAGPMAGKEGLTTGGGKPR
jgi:hypothetical protein